LAAHLAPPFFLAPEVMQQVKASAARAEAEAARIGVG
jgi:hypothetical protein